MPFTLRKVERRTLWEASQPVSLNPESFSKLTENPYTGDLVSEEEFVAYIQSLYFEDFYEIGNELEELGFVDDANSMFTIFEGELKAYSDSSENGETSWFEIGEENPEYRKVGGFKSKFDTME